MKIRISRLACVLVAPALIAGCAIYKNPSACEASMRSTLAEKSPTDKLKISHVGVAIGGERVVVEGTIESLPAAEPASAPVAASASASSSASAAAAAAPKAKPKKIAKPAAVECTFTGEESASFRWLAPPDMVAAPASDSSDAD
jgi:hypothetical protein